MSYTFFPKIKSINLLKGAAVRLCNQNFDLYLAAIYNHAFISIRMTRRYSLVVAGSFDFTLVFVILIYPEESKPVCNFVVWELYLLVTSSNDGACDWFVSVSSVLIDRYSVEDAFISCKGQ
jgi:hypothetical protein